MNRMAVLINSRTKLIVIMLMGYGVSLAYTSCSNCEPWGDQADRCFAEMKSLYLQDSAYYNYFEHAMEAQLDGLDFNHASAQQSTWNIDSLDQIMDTQLRRDVLRFFKANDFESGIIRNSNMVCFHPRLWQKHNADGGNCPAFSYELCFVKKTFPIANDNPHSRWYIIANHWYLSTSSASL